MKHRASTGIGSLGDAREERKMGDKGESPVFLFLFCCFLSSASRHAWPTRHAPITTTSATIHIPRAHHHQARTRARVQFGEVANERPREPMAMRTSVPAGQARCEVMGR